MKLFGYCNDNGEIKQEEIEVEEKVILVPINKGGSFPFTYEKSIDRANVGVVSGYFNDTVFYSRPSFDMAKEEFLQRTQQRFSESQANYEQKKFVLEKLLSQEDTHADN